MRDQSLLTATAALMLGAFILLFGLGYIGVSRVVTPAAQATVAPVTGIEQWADYMRRWESQYGVPIDVQRTLMRLESGGDWRIEGRPVQWRGTELRAVGLFQVMPFESRLRDYGITREQLFDPDTNALVGLTYLIGCNQLAGGGWTDRRVMHDTFQCYHGGHTRSLWGTATRRYADVAVQDLGLLDIEPTPAAQPDYHDRNICYLPDIDCSHPDPAHQAAVWEAGWWRGHYLYDDLRDLGLEREGALGECLMARKSATRCKLGLIGVGAVVP